MLQPDYVCRVCLADGAWNIFSTNVINDNMCTVASINSIREKLQYVTELQLHEDDGLPIRICELCIIQLNLAYRFKRLATDSDDKLRQTLQTNDILSVAHNSLSNVDDPPLLQAEPLIKLEELSEEITIEPTTVNEERIDAIRMLPETVISKNPFIPDGIPAMVCVQKDIINPAEDEAYLEGIKKMEVISMSWPTNEETKTDQMNSSTSASMPTAQPEMKQKTSQQRRKRKRAESNQQPRGSDNDTQSRKKSSKKKSKQRSTASTTISNQKQNSSDTGSTKVKTKPTEAELRKKRLQKVLNQLHIDMMYNTTAGRHSSVELQPTPHVGTGSPKLPMKRRNSICVSSFAPWL